MATLAELVALERACQRASPRSCSPASTTSISSSNPAPPPATASSSAGIGPNDLLLGLYHGIPLTRRGDNYNLVVPDKISIYQDHIEAICETDDEIREQVRKTVLHELGHYFGIDDDRLHDHSAWADAAQGPGKAPVCTLPADRA
ncbi:metallopeptidase family protein [Tepidiforma flava]|uniref:Metallopeptidase family protein n=1 Tax=Tepidiforma flava TaxID=3004094 RepID=A0ABY7M562_9CHLR|nr:metallopeptidase family protein [Tepidiforma flava]WBL35224.1 metallopeptidase family protein [Tepidiforma flava]